MRQAVWGDLKLKRRAKTQTRYVTRDGADDPLNPKNWQTSKKWNLTVQASAYNFISPVSSTMAAPALTAIGADLHTSEFSETEVSLISGALVADLFVGWEFRPN